MWFEVNVRLSEVTDLKWPHGTEWLCGNSTLAISWPKQVQILSFASMAARQGAVKHGFVSKIAGGCSSYDVIAPWPDLTWSIFLPKVVQGLPHKVPQNPAALRAAVFFAICENLRGGGLHQLSGRGLTLAPLGGPKGPPCGFSQIAPEVLGISLWNLPYLSGQQFHTLCQKIRTQVIIGQPWVTSEWRHVSPILISKMGLRESPPLVQF